MGEVKKGFLKRPLFFVFIVLFVVTYAVCECMLADCVDTKSETVKLQGEVYREAWNNGKSLVFVPFDKDAPERILINCSKLEDTYIANILEMGFAELSCKISTQETAGNFGEFDYCKYLKTHKIEFCAYPKEGEIFAAKCGEEKHSLSYYASLIRRDIESCLIKYLGEEYSGWVMSIMTGYTGGLEAEDKENLSLAGFSHLVAVSGAHIVYFAMPFEFLLKKVRLEKVYKKIILLLPIVFLWFVAGSSPSVGRAVIMAVVSTVSYVARKPYDAANALGISGIIQILLNPFCVYSTGFLLSYGAVISMVIILPALKKRIKVQGKLFDSLVTGFAVNAGILPVLLYLFNGFSIAGAIVNVAASWAANFLCVSGYGVYILDKLFLPEAFTRILSTATIGAAEIFGRMAEVVANGDSFFTRFESGSPSILFFAAYYLCIVLLVVGRKSLKGVVIGFACVIVAALFASGTQVNITIFDVGQGSAALVRSRDGVTGLIDTGDGSTKLSNLLLKEGVKKLDFLVISHGHNDHYGGLEEVLENVPVERIFVPANSYDEYCLALEEAVNDSETEVLQVDGLARYSFGKDGVISLFESNFNQQNLNNGSVIVEISGSWGSALFPGDAEDEVLEEYIERGLIKENTIMCLPHHGSISSGSENFLFSTRPKYVIISVGRDNQYGHPSGIVLDRLKQLGIKSQHIYRTDEDGAVRIKVGRHFVKEWEFVYVWPKRVKLSQLLQI